MKVKGKLSVKMSSYMRSTFLEIKGVYKVPGKFFKVRCLRNLHYYDDIQRGSYDEFIEECKIILRDIKYIKKVGKDMFLDYLENKKNKAKSKKETDEIEYLINTINKLNIEIEVE